MSIVLLADSRHVCKRSLTGVGIGVSMCVHSSRFSKRLYKKGRVASIIHYRGVLSAEMISEYDSPLLQLSIPTIPHDREGSDNLRLAKCHSPIHPPALENKS